MITLPEPPRRAHVRSFWLGVSMMLGSVILLAGILLAVAHPIILAIGATAIIAAAGFTATESVRPAYAAWNAAVRLIARSARLLVTGICFFIVVVAVGRCGARLKRTVAANAGSGWVRRQPMAAGAQALPLAEAADGSSASGVARVLLPWAFSSGNSWAVVLLPFLWLLAVLAEAEDEDPLPAHIYTLF